MPRVNAALLGFGNVARAFARKVSSLEHYQDLSIRIRAASDSSGGLLLSRDEDLDSLLAFKEGGEPLAAHGKVITGPLDFIEALPTAGVSVLVESLPTNIENGQPALELIRRALLSGLNVVTVDKGPLVHGFDTLQEAARSGGSRLAFSGTTGVAIPEDLAGARVLEIAGVLNGTTNYILTEMRDRGIAFDQALARAQADDIAEPDPSLDVDGWDTGAKILILAKVLMKADVTLAEVSRAGIGEQTKALIRTARVGSKVVHLVGRVREDGGRLAITVKPELVGAESPFFSLRGTSKLAVFRTTGRDFISIGSSGRYSIAQTILDDVIRVTAN